MPYAALVDVLEDAPQLRISATSKPSTTQAEAIILDINARVDSFIYGLGFEVPVTGPESVKILKDIVVQGSLAKILKAMFYGVRNPNEVGANDAWREFTKRLEALRDPNDPTTLPDAATSQQGDKRTLDISGDALLATQDEVDAQLWKPTRDQVF